MILILYLSFYRKHITFLTHCYNSKGYKKCNNLWDMYIHETCPKFYVLPLPLFLQEKFVLFNCRKHGINLPHPLFASTSPMFWNLRANSKDFCLSFMHQGLIDSFPPNESKQELNDSCRHFKIYCIGSLVQIRQNFQIKYRGRTNA